MTSEPLRRFLANRSGRSARTARLRMIPQGTALDAALQTYQGVGRLILRTTVFPSLLILASVAFVLFYVMPAFGVTDAPGDTRAQVGEAILLLALAFAVGGPLMVFGLAYSNAVSVKLTADYLLGRVPEPKAAVDAARRIQWRLFWLTLLQLVYGWAGIVVATISMMLAAVLGEVVRDDALWSGLFALFGIVGYLIGAVMLPVVTIYYGLAPSVMVIEDVRSPFAALRRARELLKEQGHASSGVGVLFGGAVMVSLIALLAILGILASFGIVNSLLTIESLSAFGHVGPLVAEAIRLSPWFLAIWAVMPAWSIFCTLVYFDRRIRLEGYDIQLLKQEVLRADRHNRFEV